MTKQRVPQTDHATHGELAAKIYDQLQRRIRDKGWIETKDIINSGIRQGLVLEVGPGPGYLGLEWLKQTRGTILKGIDISADMIAIAQLNAHEYGMTERTEYVQGSGDNMPFENEHFHAVFTSNSLHEWSDPKGAFNEIWRVLKKGGRLFVSDMKRDMLFLFKWAMWLITKPKEKRPGLIASINAAYTRGELRQLLNEARFKSHEVKEYPMRLKATGIK